MSTGDMYWRTSSAELSTGVIMTGFVLLFPEEVELLPLLFPGEEEFVGAKCPT